MLIGLTGGIATGKSTVSEILTANGIPVIDADKIARRLAEKGEPIYNSILKAFGEAFLLDNGELNRSALAELIFSDSQARERLNAITHPLITKEIEKSILQIQDESESKPIVIDAATLIESGWYKRLDVIWLVILPEDIQIQRLMSRDQVTECQAKSRIGSQMSQQDKMKYADHLIDNSGTIEETRDRVLHLLSTL